MSGRIVSSVLAAALVVGMPAVGTANAVGRQGRAPEIQLRPTSGPAETQLQARARGLSVTTLCYRDLKFQDSAGTLTLLQSLPITESFHTQAAVPGAAATGVGMVMVVDVRPVLSQCRFATHPYTVASAQFTVTP
jgi:hypothetical protein